MVGRKKGKLFFEDFAASKYLLFRFDVTLTHTFWIKGETFCPT